MHQLYRQGNAHKWLLGDEDVAPRSCVWVWSATDNQLEDDGEWIQWAFPCRHQSAYNLLAPVLTTAEIDAIKADKLALDTLRGNVIIFLRFLANRTDWVTQYTNHNRARITRAIKCCTIMGLYDEAQQIYDYAMDRCGTDIYSISSSYRHWKDALVA